MNDTQRFYESDVITVRGTVYEITAVDRTLRDGEVIQYQLEARHDDLAAHLKPERDGKNVITEYHSVNPDDITVIE